MVPLRLHLHNFLSYGDSSEPIVLDGIHVACLCGPNGHGKSALLDAITWVLWGQARSNTADDLVRLGQTSMFVELDFVLDGRNYRAIRKRSRGRASQSDLQFQAREEDGQWRALTGQGVRGTQERINQALRMDYETFVNSAFILQGQSDAFARKTPDKRKQILGEILNLRIYDQLCDAARARRAAALTRGSALEGESTRLEREHARLPELKAQVERLTAEHAAAQLAVAEARAKYQEILVEKSRLDARRKERDDLLRRLERAEGELKTVRDQLAAAQARVTAWRSLTERAAEIKTRFQDYLAVSHQRDQMTARLLEAQALQKEQGRLEKQLGEARHSVEKDLHGAGLRVAALQAKIEHLPRIVADIADLERQVAVLDRLQEEQATLQARLPELAGERAGAVADQRRWAEEMERADERFRLLKAARAACPTCEAPLPDETRLELGRKLREEKTALKEAQGRAIQREAEAKRAEAELHRRLKELEGKLKTGQEMRNRLAQARHQHLNLNEAVQELPEEMEILRGLQARLEAGEFAPETARALAEVEAKIRSLSYDDQDYRQVIARFNQLSGADREMDALARAEASLPGDLAQEETLNKTIRAQEEALADDRAARAEADRELTQAAAVEAEVTRLELSAKQAERAEAELSQRLGVAGVALESCRELAPQIVERKREREAASKDQAAYEELGKAFGRNGIQALIIENALPEIETEANALLTRMSDGQLNVRLKTQRELRAGGQGETLEIEISDGMGARRYELYSGGEAFRVDFAIRIALSKLLARRAGARLETLFIDEGFGSQDQDGRMRLVEAIQAVQDDFARILVITHIDELKDAFPTRIEVHKGPSGSQVAVY
jgi:exonuclease SbcC